MERMALVRQYESMRGPVLSRPTRSLKKLHGVVGQWDMAAERGRAGFDKTSEDPPCLVFEWMEHVLWNVREEPYRERSVLPKIDCPFGSKSTRYFCICKCDAYRLALSALAVTLVVLVRSDVHPNNILLSRLG